MYTNEIGVFTRVTAAATGTVSFGVSTKPAALLGILVGSVGTAPTVNIFQGQVTGNPVIGTITCAANAFTRIPAYLSGGGTVYVSGVTTPDLTIYWNPLG